jgi:hypothetical protein
MRGTVTLKFSLELYGTQFCSFWGSWVLERVHADVKAFHLSPPVFLYVHIISTPVTVWGSSVMHLPPPQADKTILVQESRDIRIPNPYVNPTMMLLCKREQLPKTEVILIYSTLTEVFHLNWEFSTLTEVFPCFFLGCKANARVKFAKTGHGPHFPIFLSLYSVLFVCKCVMYCCILCTVCV